MTVVQTTEVAEWFRQNTFVRRLAVIPNALRHPDDLRVSASNGIEAASRPLILGIGRLTKQKGFDLLIDAFFRSRLPRQGWHLAILGEGEERQALLKQAADLGIADSVTLPGYVANVGSWLEQTEIFVLSSRYEGFPNALIEAMQMGRACISFDCLSGPRDLLAGGRHGILVPAEDVVGLSAALRDLAGDAERRLSLGGRARSATGWLAPSRIYGKWIDLFDAAAARTISTVLSNFSGQNDIQQDDGAHEDLVVATPSRGRIMFAIGSLALGGTETQLTILASELHKRGWVVDVFALEKDGLLVDRLEQAGVCVLDGGYRPGKTTGIGRHLALLMSEARLVWRILRTRPNVVHGFLPLTNFMGALAARLTLVPRIITSKRALGRHQDRRPGWWLFDRLANAFSDVVTANSNAVADDTKDRDGYDRSRIVVIHNGLDFSRFDCVSANREAVRRQLGLSPDEIGIVLVANLIPYKGHIDLIQAFSRVALDDPRPKLFLIGRDDGIGTSLVTESNRLGVAERIRIMGSRSDVPALLLGMDLGVMASHEEGFSNALLEKLAAGLPVVATNVGGNPEMLDGMPDCILVRPQDVSDLARGLREAIGQLDAADANREVRRTLNLGKIFD